MCINDWRLGRLISTQITRVAGLSSAAFNGNMSRVGFEVGVNTNTGCDPISGTLGDYAMVEIEGVAPLVLSLYHPFIRYNLAENGSTPNKPFVVSVQQNLGCEAYIIEYFLPEKILSEQIESLYAKPYGGYKP